MLSSRKWLGAVGFALSVALALFRLYVAIFVNWDSYLGVDGFMNMLYTVLEIVGFALITVPMLLNKLTKHALVGALLLITDIGIGVFNFTKMYFSVDYKSAPFICSIIMALAPFALLVHMLLKKRKQEMCPVLFYLAPALYIIFGLASQEFTKVSVYETIALGIIYAVIGVWIDLLEFDISDEFIWE